MIDTLNDHKDELLLAIERFQLVAKATHDVIWDWDLVNNTLWWNEGLQLIFGYPAEDTLVGPGYWVERIHPEDRERVEKKIFAVIDTGQSNWSDFYRFRRADGTYAYVHDRGYTILSEGKSIRMVGSMMDITGQLRAEQARKESEENLKFATSAAQLGTWNMDPGKFTIAFDERCQELYGYPREEDFTYEKIIRFVHQDDRERVKTAIEKALDPVLRSPYDIRYRVVGATNHTLKWLHCKGRAYFTDEGNAYRFSGVSRDITGEISSQEKINWADQQAAMTIEGSGAGSFLVSLADNDIIYSPTMAKILTGEDNSQITRDIFIDHVHPDDMLIREEAYQKAAGTGQLRFEARFIWKDRSIHWVRVIGQYLYDSVGKAISLSGIVMDITDRVLSEHQLKTSAEHLRTLISQAPVATTLFVGKEMIIEMPNEAMLKVWGKGDNVIGKPLKEALPELVGQPFLDILENIYETGEPYAEQAARCELVIDGVKKTFYFNFTYKPLKDANGDIYAILDMAVDVTDQVQSRKELEKSEDRYRQLANELERRVQQRTEELHQANQELVNSNNNLQQFAYAASHDMQEPLRKIQAFSSRLQTVYSKELEENGAFMLNRIQDASKRMSMMIDDLLAYSRLTTREAEFKPVALKDIVTNVLADLEISIQEQKTNIAVNELPVVWGNPLQLTQLIQNLLSNAIKYKNQELPSEIRISAADADPEIIKTLPKLLPEHSYICFEVADNGIGFDEIYLDRIFQMFQRLHGRGEFSGSGIGLALCKKVVQNHHGYITARSQPGKGSVFMVYLPKPA